MPDVPHFSEPSILDIHLVTRTAAFRWYTYTYIFDQGPLNSPGARLSQTQMP